MSHVILFVFRVRGYNYFWVPVIGPHLGGILGAFVYQFMVGFHWPDTECTINSTNYTKDDSTHGQTQTPSEQINVPNDKM